MLCYQWLSAASSWGYGLALPAIDHGIDQAGQLGAPPPYCISPGAGGGAVTETPTARPGARVRKARAQQKHDVRQLDLFGMSGR